MSEITLSFSQASTYESCQRKWAYRYLYALPSIPGPALVYGKKVHQEIEDYLNNQVLIVDPDSLGLKARTYIEGECTDSYDVEAHLQYQTGDTTIHGYADVLLHYCDGRKGVIDWKTSKRKPKTMKPEHRAQLHLYGFMADLKRGDQLTIAYPEYGIIFDIDYDPEHGEKVVNWMIDVADEIRWIYLNCTQETEEANFATNTTPLCGWCEYLDQCPEGQSYKTEYDDIRKKIKARKR
jgi:hypothetical protein